MTERLDYMFFVYGLSFLLMAVQCLVLRSHERSLPWGLLAAFGIIHGINEWLDMLAISLPDTPAFKCVRLVMMAVSFVALLEFGRRGLKRNGRHSIAPWLTVTLIGVAALSVLFVDINVIQAACRYALGFPAALMASAAIWRASRVSESSMRYGLVIAACSMMVYSFAAGLVVPKAAFFPANWLNYDSFISSAGFPVQFIRMSCAFALMTAFWIYDFRGESAKVEIGFLRRWSFPGALLLLLALGSFATGLREKNIDTDIRNQLLDQAQRIADTISPELVKSLSFTESDRNNPSFQCLREELIAAARIGHVCGIHSLALRGGKLTFGPESYPHTDPLASPPGTVLENPAREELDIFSTRKQFVVGPITNEYGNFVIAYSPVIDPRTGKALMAVGVSIRADDWKAQAGAVRLPPIFGTIVLSLFFLGGMGMIQWRDTLVEDKRARYRHLESIVIATIGLTLTVMLSLLTWEFENSEHGRIFQEIAQMYAEKVGDEFRSLHSDVVELGRFWQTDEQVTRQEFHDYTNPMIESGTAQELAWINPGAVAKKSAFQSAPHQKYYPVIFAEPLGKKSIAGFYEGSRNIERAALEKAARTRLSTAIDSSVAINKTAGKRALLAFCPVFETGVAAGRNLLGFSVGRLQYQTILDYAIGGDAVAANMVETHLADLMSVDGPSLLAVTPNYVMSLHSKIVSNSYLAQYKFKATFPVFAFGRAYAVVLHPTRAFFVAYPARNYLMTGVACLFITIAISLLTYYIRNRQIFLEREVGLRTLELSESEDRFRSLFKGSHDAVMILEPPLWNFTSCNQATVEMFGAKDVEEFVTYGPTQVSPEMQPGGHASADKAREMIETALREGSHYFEWTHMRIGGEQFPATVLLSRIEQGGKTFLQATVRDITLRKQAEEALQESKALIDAVVENVPHMIFLKEATDLRFVIFNRAGEELLGYDRNMLLGRNNLDLFPPEQAANFMAKDREVLDGDAGSLDIPEELIQTARKGTRLLHTRKICIRGADGNTKYLLGISEDITERKQAEDALHESEERFSNAFEYAAIGMALVSLEGGWFKVNQALCDIFGYSEEELLAKTFLDITHPDDLAADLKYVRQVLNGDISTYRMEKRYYHKLGNVVWIMLSVSLVRDSADIPLYFVSQLEDITDRKQAEEALQDSEATVRNITDSAQDAILMMNSRGLIVFWNPAAERILGYTACEAIGQNLHEFLVPERYLDAHNQAFPGFQRTGRGNAIGQMLELHAIRKDNVEIDVSLSLSAVQKNGEWGAVGILRDITAQKLAEDELRQANAEIDNVNRLLEEALLAAHQHVIEVEVAKELVESGAAEMEYQIRHDALTDLPNRLLFSEELDETILDHSNNGRQCAVMFLDLDNFKMVNDTMGHKAGDMLLVQTAARLSSCLRENDILARMGGDEFTVLLKNIKSIEDVAVVSQRMLECISVPYEIDGTKLVVGVSIGSSIYPDNANDTVELLKGADAAMYKAKELGRNNCQFFSEEISLASRARADMERELRLALERDELKVYYQPIVDVRTMRIAGAEALIRWDHPENGMMSPGLFLPVAEEAGLIAQMGKNVMATACKQCKNWQDAGYEGFEISVNVSPAQLGEIGIVSEVHEALSDAGLNPSYLKLEVTETVLAKNDNDEVDILTILRSLGGVICLDDFGIGYSSLSRLNNLPIGHMKIDGCFIRNITHNRKDRAMTESIIGMAHNLGIKVTAEWIEDEEQLAVIKVLDCDYAQGYLISPALSAEAFGEFIQNWKQQHMDTDAA